jgi:hypothetical protein
VVAAVLPPALDTAGLQAVTCKPDNEEGPPWHAGGRPRYPPDYPYCGRVKYHWPKGLRFRGGPFLGAPDVVKTGEWFGSGGAAARAVLVSQRAAELVRGNHWRGVTLRVVTLVG